MPRYVLIPYLRARSIARSIVRTTPLPLAIINLVVCVDNLSSSEKGMIVSSDTQYYQSTSRLCLMFLFINAFIIIIIVLL